MTTMKKLVSLVLAVMMLCISAAAFATEDETPATYTLTITGEKGHTYEAYQIFTGDLSGDVLSNIKLGDGVDAGILTYNGTTYTDAAALAAELNSANVDSFMAHASQYLTTVAGTSVEDPEGTYTISNLKAGYYLIQDESDSVPEGGAYTKFIARIVKDTDATPKTEVTILEKKVSENEKYTNNASSANGYEYGATYNDVADYNIGDEVPFSLYSKVPNLENFKHYEMTFHDTMGEGLTFLGDSVKVYVGGTELTSDAYELTTTCDDGCTFHLKIKELINNSGADVRVDFHAQLNSKAVIGLPGNPNESYLSFSNNPNYDPAYTGGDTTPGGPGDNSTTNTPEDYVVVFTYELDVTKVDGADNSVTLKGAEFVLQNAAGEYATVNDEGILTGWVASKDEATVLKSDENGKFKVIGLDDGEYKLEETKAPDGYNLIPDPIKLDVVAATTNDHSYAKEPTTALTGLTIAVGSGAAADGNVETGIVETMVKNNVGATLPETGGIGTTIFYVVGGVLVLAAIVLLVTKRRVGEEN